MIHKPHIPIAIALIFAALLACSALQSVAPAVPGALPTVTPPAGWHSLQHQGFHAWVPESFISGAQLDMDSLLQTMRQLGPDYAGAADSIQLQGLTYEAYAVDTHSSAAGRITSMLVGKVTAGSAVDITRYTEALANKLLARSSDYHLIGKEVETTGRYPAGMLAVEVRTPQTPGVTQAIYAVQNGGVFWHIVFTTPSAEFAGRSAVFQQISSSVTLPYSLPAPTVTGLPVSILIGLSLLILAALAVLILALMVFARSRKKAAPVSAPVSTAEQTPAPKPAPASEAKTVAQPAEPPSAAPAALAPQKRTAARKKSPARQIPAAKPPRKVKRVPRKNPKSAARKKPKAAGKP